jgi:hypothetical protein
MISIFSCESTTNDKLKNEDTKFFGKEASLMVLEEWKRRSPGLFELVSSQPDFVNEVTLLQYFTEQRSVPAGCQAQSVVQSWVERVLIRCSKG